MTLPYYQLAASIDHLKFEFYSHGPRGNVRKVISYTKLEGFEAYNLGFGDYNEETGEIDDLTVSNNHDRDKVLGTIANSALYFFHKYPSAQVAFMGSTPVRTRLYVMQISKHWNLVSQFVSVQGLLENEWEPFRQNRSYRALLVETKKS